VLCIRPDAQATNFWKLDVRHKTPFEAFDFNFCLMEIYYTC